MFPRIVWILALAGTCVLSPGPAAARDLTLPEAVDRAIAGSPALRAEHAAIRATERQAQLDGLPPPVTLGGEVENLAGTGTLSGIDSAETTVRIGRTFELGGKRAARRALGAARIAEQVNLAGRRHLDVAAEATRRFIDVMSTQAHLELAAQELALARETRAAIAHRVQRSASPEADLPLAELATIRAELEVEDAGHEFATARVALSVLWGAPEPDFEHATGSLVRLPDLPPFEALAGRASRGADGRQFTLEADRLAAELRSADAQRRPDIGATLGVRRLEAVDDQALVLSFSVPIGLARRSNLAVARGRAERDGLDERRRAFELERHRELFTRYEEARHARHVFEALRDRMIPAAERALALAQRGYDEARYSFLQVAQARGVLHALLKDRIATASRYHHLLTDIERATAAPGESEP